MIGKYTAKLDEKSRLFVPSKLRGELGETFFVTLGVNCGVSPSTPLPNGSGFPTTSTL